MAKPTNPTRVSLEGKTVFPVRCAIDLLVEVIDQPTESNGQTTGQRRAEEKAAEKIANLFSLANWWQLAGKGVFRAPSLPTCDIYGEMRPDCRVWDEHWNDYQGQCFDAMLSMGNGDYSSRNCQILMARLDKAFCWLSGLQQGGQDEKGERFIEDLARDVVMALTGKEFVFVEETK